MTNNEKRAHDVALKCMELAYTSKIKFPLTDTDSIYKELYRIYIDSYEEVLEALNRAYS
ncbi:hypothetical protein SAMN02745245_00446 [Anaerosphaera aminiphila DSM 21120]|uniref:Uncharacterized protein n=1 Tax=Anaerosphaera aminiphila DSM 21120 TaxID=1120995 RepID=A0A1M5PS48_9FIRM|nr:hypothetical protein [Anaerosphaera aminiphila]SHH04572.1 hypothetical protein SAMN02745245_00446 [Anaerosphaera aminiphila DSM 21120]